MEFQNILWGILGLSLVVVAHEAGHYVAARLAGIDVEVFSIGWGKRLVGFRRGETDYRLSILPLGGYCKLKGERSLIQAWETESDTIPYEKGAFYSAPVWKRILVSLAGPIANIVFSALILSATAWIGYTETYQEPRIVLASEWIDGPEVWPADSADLRSGDVILAVDEKPIQRYSQLRENVALSLGNEITLTVERDGRIHRTTMVPVLDDEGTAGIIGVFSWVDPVIESVDPRSPADIAGIRPGDRVVSVDGMETPHTAALSVALSDKPDGAVFGVEREGSLLAFSIKPEESVYGLVFALPRIGSPELGPLASLGEGIRETSRYFALTVRSLRMLFQGIRVDKAVSGPLRLTWYVGSVASSSFGEGFGAGLRASFGILAFISVALAFMNLLPIPVLDGGQIILFLFESVRRRPLAPKSVYRYQFIGTMIVITLVIFVTASDVFFFAGR